MKACFVLPPALLLALASGYGQCFRLGEVNTEKPEGQLLQSIGQESDEARKLTLLEKFAAEYPKHESAGWVYEQLQALYLKANNPDKALETGDKIAALAPGCVELMHQTLKAAEAKKDADLIRKWSALTSEAALKAVNAPKPKEEDEVETWKKHVDYARQVNQYSEYALYAAGLQNPDPKKKIELFEALEQRNPKSEYLPQGYSRWFLAYRQTNAHDKAMALAEKAIAAGQPDEDMLLVVASDYLQKKKEPEKVFAYTAKIVEILASKPKPQGIADADWEKHKSTVLGLAHYMGGSLYFAQNKFAPADRELRQALPHISDAGLKAEVLFNLGQANYKLEKAQDAATYFRECAAIKSRYQAVAAKNLAAVKAEYRGIK